MYHARGSSHELCAIGTVCLKPLLSKAESFGDSLELRSSQDESLFATIDYRISIRKEMADALVAQKVFDLKGTLPWTSLSD